MVAIIDYEAGNIGSIKNMIRKIGKDAVITADKSVISRADKIILPGVGHFDYGMSQLANKGLVNVLNDEALTQKKHILGICLGMQLMTRGSEEGKQTGLGWFHADVKKFTTSADGTPLRVPHMGWNRVHTPDPANPLFKDMPENPRFYFVHSYFAQADKQEEVLTTTQYGIEFVSGLYSGNIFGVQFHPEKSHKFGMQLLKNFLSI